MSLRQVDCVGVLITNQFHGLKCHVQSGHQSNLPFAAQDVFNLLPNLSVEELLRSFAIKSNDMMLAVYLASMIRRSDTYGTRTHKRSCTHTFCMLRVHM